MGYTAPTWQNGGPPALNAQNMQDISDNLAYVSNHMVNPNLLDNWYFGNPVNQRGQTRYEAANTFYGVDRWKILGTDAYMTVTPGSLKGIGYISQLVDNSNLFEGMQLTLSALLSDNTFGSKTFRMSKGMENPIAINSNGHIVYAEWQNTNEFFSANWYTPSEAVGLVAIKLEPGPQQTLAHKEYGKWVLNEIPKFGDQLAECQRYYYRVHYTQYQTINMAYEDTSYAFIMLPLPVAMRIDNPVLTQSKPIALGSSEKIMTAAEAKGCMARLGVAYAAISNAQRPVYSYCADPEGVTFELSADL